MFAWSSKPLEMVWQQERDDATAGFPPCEAATSCCSVWLVLPLQSPPAATLQDVAAHFRCSTTARLETLRSEGRAANPIQSPGVMFLINIATARTKASWETAVCRNWRAINTRTLKLFLHYIQKYVITLRKIYRKCHRKTRCIGNVEPIKLGSNAATALTAQYVRKPPSFFPYVQIRKAQFRSWQNAKRKAADTWNPRLAWHC